MLCMELCMANAYKCWLLEPLLGQLSNCGRCHCWTLWLPPTLAPGFGSLDAPCPGQKVPLGLRQQGSWTQQAGEEPVDIMFLRKNGKWECPGQGTALWDKHTRNIHAPSPLPRASPATLGLWVGGHLTEMSRSASTPGTSVHTHTV